MDVSRFIKAIERSTIKHEFRVFPNLPIVDIANIAARMNDDLCRTATRRTASCCKTKNALAYMRFASRWKTCRR